MDRGPRLEGGDAAAAEARDRQRRGRGFQSGAQGGQGKLYSDDARSGDRRNAGQGGNGPESTFGHDNRTGGRPLPRSNYRPAPDMLRGRGTGPGQDARPGPDPAEQSNTSPPLASTPARPDLEYGVIVTVRDSFGFVQCYRRDQQVFFHVSELQNEAAQANRKPDLTTLVEPGEEVEFVYVESDPRTGRPMARQVRVLAKGWLDQEEVEEGLLNGVVERELRGGQKSRSDAYGGRIAVTSEDNERVFYSFSGADLIDVNQRLSVGDEVVFQVATGRRKGGEAHATKIKYKGRPRQQQNAGRRGEGQPETSKRERGVVATLKESFGFVKRGGPVEGRLFFHFSAVEGERQLRINDEVEYTVRPDRNNDKELAVDVKLLPKGSLTINEVSEDRKTGVVAKAASKQRSQEYEDGLIHWRDPSGKNVMLSFGSHHLQDPEADLNLGDEVTFRVASRGLARSSLALEIALSKPWTERRELGVILLIKDGKFGFIKCMERDEDMFFHMSELEEGTSEVAIGDTVEFTPVRDYRTGKDNAVKFKLVPKDAVVMDEVCEERLEGTCTERVKDAKGRGQLEYKKGGVTEALPFATSDLEDYRWIPRVGDKVEFQTATDKRTGKKRAVNVAISEVEGTVDYLKDSYGFIACPGAEPNRVFFHTSEVQGGVTIKEQDQVAFIIVHNIRTDETAAKKVRRIKEAGERPKKPLMSATSGTSGASDEPATAVAPQKSGIKFEGNTSFRIAKGPDETRGFTAGRGKCIDTLPALRKPKQIAQQIGEPQEPRAAPGNEAPQNVTGRGGPVASSRKEPPRNHVKGEARPNLQAAQAPKVKSAEQPQGTVITTRQEVVPVVSSSGQEKPKPKLTSKLDPTSAPFTPSGIYANLGGAPQGGPVGSRSSGIAATSQLNCNLGQASAPSQGQGVGRGESQHSGSHTPGPG